METNLNHPSDKDNMPAEADSTEAGPEANANRRRFTRNAVVGSAVLFSLGNRAAWAQSTTCVSEGFMTSFTGPAFSASPEGSLRQLEEDKAAKILLDPDRYTNANGDICTDT